MCTFAQAIYKADAGDIVPNYYKHTALYTMEERKKSKNCRQIVMTS